MAYNLYSYRFKKVMPLMDEHEWNDVDTLLMASYEKHKSLRNEKCLTREEAKQLSPIGLDALNRYFEMTCVRLDNPDQLNYLRLSNYGALCPKCDKPFRTPQAKICVECGYELPEGKVAGKINLKTIADKKI